MLKLIICCLYCVPMWTVIQQLEGEGKREGAPTKYGAFIVLAKTERPPSQRM